MSNRSTETDNVPHKAGTATTRSIRVAYEEFGATDAPPILLIMGFGAQLTLWPTELCESLAREGFRVIRFDNRDIGLSTKFEGMRVDGSSLARMVRSQLGMPSTVPYTLHDMAADTRNFLDALGIERAHLVGASMGGMITQLVAATYPARVASASIVFSSTNERFLPPPAPTALKALLTAPPKNATMDEIVEHSARNFRVLGGPAFPRDHEELRELSRTQIERSYYPQGMVRQLAAVLGSGSLRPYAQRIKAPTTVIHGTADPLLRPACGRAVARAIPGARLSMIEGMGHDLPAAVTPRLASEILENIARAAENE
ncbi:alpha/beta fold hydrolase [Hoyosella altamirensis]|uniref:Pimeloyl-ACP methyl ester carboxylesterase n=1 Tax=Hoyosella altamirensis TaxID=616997 RepID=A0A839RNC9_9ACTN|nr:alpha/beta hydrolase [Hoyosella altamirensis]MBB3037698.1 pimeloyl-ACP methyl ester carboxylesterase [Hoyosella altamirensis]